MKEKMKSHPYLFLAAVFALLFLAGNELAAVTDTAESNYALTAREMVLSGAFGNPFPFMEAGSEGNAPRPSDFRHGVISSSLRAVVHIHDRLSRHRFPFEFLRCP